MENTGQFSYTRHALRRIAQRGIRAEALRLALAYGATYSIRGGCAYLQMPKAALAEIARDGLCPDMVKAVSTLQVVLGDGGEVITCYHATARVRANSRRKGRKARHAAMGG